MKLDYRKQEHMESGSDSIKTKNKTRLKQKHIEMKQDNG